MNFGTKFRLIFLPLFCASSLAFAHSGATGIVLERMEQMKSIADGMKAIGGELRKDMPGVALVTEIATTIAAKSRHVPMMFPEGSFNMPSEASLKILEDPGLFAELANAMEEQALALAKLAESNPDKRAITVRFQELGATCKSCHQKFREKR